MHWQTPAFIGATLLSWVLTKFVLAQLKNRAILDCPNQRSSHKSPTPRGGGIEVITDVILCWAYPASQSPLLLAILAGAILLALVLARRFTQPEHRYPPLRSISSGWRHVAFCQTKGFCCKGTFPFGLTVLSHF